MAQGDDDTIASAQASLPSQSLVQGAPVPELIAGRYRIQRWLGGGGMGRVYAAVDAELGEQIALKVLRDGLTDDAIERFRREVRLTRRIQHRNVARMFDIGEHAGVKFLTMELVEGVPLTQLATPLMSWRKLATIAAQLCEGLSAAHAAGVIHRDLKPDNVIVEKGTERAVITDFGIARSLDESHVTQVGAVVGTPRYMSPEQLAGGEIDSRSDLFALGVMLYELATGERPWSGDNAITIAVAQATQPMKRLVAAHVPQSFIAIVEQCLAIAPGDRPASARAIADALTASTVVEGRGSRPGLTTPPAGMPAPAALPSQPTNPPPSTTGNHALHSSLAVLPVACASGDEYLADGMLDDLIDALSQSSVRVRPAGIVRDVGAPDPRAIGRQLEVDHVATLALRRIPAGLRVSARLISVGDGFQIWAHRVDCTESTVLETADELARGIAAALSARAQTATRPTDPRAVELYLRARSELRRFWGTHAANAADLLDRAVEIAPASDAILAAHALACVQAWVMTTEAQHAPRARAALERGLATGHGEAFLAAAIYKMNRGQPEAAAVDLATAVARAPMSAPAHEIAGRVLVEVEGLGEARKHFETAIGLDPGRAQVVACDLARLDALRGDWTGAFAKIQPLLADPDLSVQQMGAVYEARFNSWRGDLGGMMKALGKFGQRLGGRTNLLHDYIDKISQGGEIFDGDTWRKFLAEFDQPDRPVRQQLMGLQLLTEVALGFGKSGSALATLAHAADLGLMDVMWTDMCPLLVPLARTQPFDGIRARIADRAGRVLAAFQHGRA